MAGPLRSLDPCVSIWLGRVVADACGGSERRSVGWFVRVSESSTEHTGTSLDEALVRPPLLLSPPPHPTHHNTHVHSHALAYASTVLRRGAISQASGSAYVEFDNTKVMVGVCVALRWGQKGVCVCMHRC